MPNLWTKATQKIAEAFSGPRTKDTEFDAKIEEMKSVEKGVAALRQVFQNFLTSTVGTRAVCRDMVSAIKNVYDKKSHYSILCNDIIEAHTDLELLYENFFNNVNKLYSKSSEWPVLFSQVKAQIQKRDDTRKTYDHYDEKLEKVYKAKQEKLKKGAVETAKDLEFLQRNEEKYKRSTEAYVKISEETYGMIQTILNKRYELVNPVLSEFIDEEVKLYTKSSQVFKKVENMSAKFKVISQAVPKYTNTYDACKYIRGGEIIKKDNNTARAYRNDMGNVDITGKNRSLSNIPTRKQVEEENARNRLKPSFGANVPNINTNFNQNANIRANNDTLYKEFAGLEDHYSKKASNTISSNINNQNSKINFFPINNVSQINNLGGFDSNYSANINPNANFGKIENNSGNFGNDNKFPSPLPYNNNNSQYNPNQYGVGVNQNFSNYNVNNTAANTNYNNTRGNFTMNNFNNFENNNRGSLTPNNKPSNNYNNNVYDNIYSKSNEKGSGVVYPSMTNNANYGAVSNTQPNANTYIKAAPDAFKLMNDSKNNKGDSKDDFFKDLF